jgi:uncharacterized repeat protein (TIGR04138 family)
MLGLERCEQLPHARALASIVWMSQRGFPEGCGGSELLFERGWRRPVHPARHGEEQHHQESWQLTLTVRMHSFAAPKSFDHGSSMFPQVSLCHREALLRICGFAIAAFMQKTDFAEALNRIVAEDPRYAHDAYHFLRDALDFTIKQRRKSRELAGQRAHVTGQQLLEGVRVYALKQFGPMVPTVFTFWGVRRCEDFGHMVFNLVRHGVFGKTETDSLDDFKDAYSFHDAFVVPYLPPPATTHCRLHVDQPAQELN